MSNDDLTPNDDSTPSGFDTDGSDDQFENFDNAEFDSAEFDSAEFDPAGFDNVGSDSGMEGESESADSTEIPLADESESRASEEIPLADEELPTDLVGAAMEEEEENEIEEAVVAEPANEWLMATFFTGAALYMALIMAFLLDTPAYMDSPIFTNPTKNVDWTLATILIPISFICFMSSSLALLSKPRGKQWLLLVPTLGPLLPILLGALAVISLISLA